MSFFPNDTYRKTHAQAHVDFVFPKVMRSQRFSFGQPGGQRTEAFFMNVYNLLPSSCCKSELPADDSYISYET